MTTTRQVPGRTPTSDDPVPASSAVRRAWWSPSPAGITLGLLLAALSATPSLLPRSAVNQGLATGIAFAAGYLIAVSLWGLVRLVAREHLPRARDPIVRRWWIAIAVAAAAAVIVCMPVWWTTQDDLRGIYAQTRLGVGDAAAATLVGMGTAAALVLAGKGLAALFRLVRDRLARRTSRGAAAARATIAFAVALLAVTATTAVAIGVSAENSAAAYNASDPPWLHEPSGATRSVGPDSALSWERAGFEGRVILGTGPTASDIAAVTGAPALDPIRIYAGVDEPGDWTAHADAVVAELVRMRADQRDAVVVAATTGSGWLDGEAIDAIEYLHSGSTALATMQYSKGESWHSFVFHPGAYREATTALLTAVRGWWLALAPENRPRLYLYGLSLGSRAVQDSFADAAAMRDFADGVVLAGTPYGTALNAELTAARDSGSAVVAPVLDGGAQFRWFADGVAVADAGGSWETPRVVFIQHGTDPIVWAGPASAWTRPEWLEPGQRSAMVHPAMRWFPVVTGIQLMFDTAVDLSAPDGAGHRYGYDTVEAWIAVTGDGGHSPEVLDAIRRQVTPRSGLPTGNDV